MRSDAKATAVEGGSGTGSVDALARHADAEFRYRQEMVTFERGFGITSDKTGVRSYAYKEPVLGELGKPLSGREAADCGLINRAVPFAQLEATVAETAKQLASIPLSQLSAMKLVVNQAYENMGLASTQTLGTILDGLMRNTTDAKRFIDIAERDGVRAAIKQRDGAFGDYSQAPKDQQPDPNNVIEVKKR